LGFGVWGLGFGGWGMGVGGLGPIPNPQSPSPIPNPQSPFHNDYKKQIIFDSEKINNFILLIIKLKII